MAKKQADIYNVRIVVSNPNIFSTYGIGSYTDSSGVFKTLKNSRGNNVEEFVFTSVNTLFDTSKVYDKNVIEWLLEHPKVKMGKIILTNLSDQEKFELDSEIESATLIAKVMSLKDQDTKEVCAVLGDNYKAIAKVRKAVLTKKAKNYKKDYNSPFQRLKRAIDNNDRAKILEIKEMLEAGVISHKLGQYSIKLESGETYRMGISQEAVIEYLYSKDSEMVLATLKQQLRESNKK